MRGRASTLAITGNARRPTTAIASSAAAHDVGRGLHQRAMERRAHLERDGLALVLGDERVGARDRLGAAGDDDLPGGVEVRRAHDLAALAAACAHSSLEQRRVDAHDRGHRALAGGDRVLHRLAATMHDHARVLDAERAGGDQRRVLAERVSGGERGRGELGRRARAAQRGARSTSRRSPAACSA